MVYDISYILVKTSDVLVLYMYMNHFKCYTCGNNLQLSLKNVLRKLHYVAMLLSVGQLLTLYVDP